MTTQLDPAPTLHQRSALATRQTPENVNTSLLQQRSSLKTKAIAIAIAIATLPLLGVGATTFLLANQSSDNPTTNKTEESNQSHKQMLLNLAIGTGTAALLVGAIA